MSDDRNAPTDGETPRNQSQSSVPGGGKQMGGGPSPADMASPGGSSGSGGYGSAQNQQFHQGQERERPSHEDGLTRGERFDEQQGGGRGSDSVSPSKEDLESDQRAHQDRGQSEAEKEVE